MGTYDRDNPKKRRQRKQRKALSWELVNPRVIGHFVHVMAGDGMAVLLGSSGDGSLLSVNVYEDGERYKYYIRTVEETIRSLGEIAEDFDRMDSIAFVGLCNGADSEKSEASKDSPKAP